MKEYWWNKQKDKKFGEEFENPYLPPPLEQSSPKKNAPNEKDYINEDLEDSIVRISKPFDDDIFKELTHFRDESREVTVNETIEEIEDGTRFRVSETINQSEIHPYRPKSPFKFRESLKNLFKWETNYESQGEYEESIIEASTIENPDLSSSFFTSDLIHKTPEKVINHNKPCSRAVMNQSQYKVFQFQMNCIRDIITDLPLYYNWAVWVNQHGKMSIDRIIENYLDMKGTIKFFKKLLDDNHCKIVVFKLGIPPNRKHHLNIDSSTIDIKVSHDDEYDLLKQLLKVVLGDNLYSPEISGM